MSGQFVPLELIPAPDAYVTFDVSVQWLDASGCWLITVSRAFQTPDGELEQGVPWQKRYGADEVTTAYQVAMLGLSDYRNRD